MNKDDTSIFQCLISTEDIADMMNEAILWLCAEHNGPCGIWKDFYLCQLGVDCEISGFESERCTDAIELSRIFTPVSYFWPGT